MVFYLIGLGLELGSITSESKNILKKCKKIYLENYTVNFPYSFAELENSINKKIVSFSRVEVEKEDFLKDPGKQDIALLVYGSPLNATTHISLILKCKKEDIQYQIIQNASIFDAIAETGLQLYKFGKTTSMPKWQKSYEPTSFLDVVKENHSINAHSLILTDIGLKSKDALKQLKKSAEEKKIKLEKIILLSQAGTKEKKIFYDTLGNLEKIDAKLPFCIIIPSKMHFLEEEALNILKDKQ